MSNTVSDFFSTCVHGWGVRRVFGFPVDGINGPSSTLLSGDPEETRVRKNTAKEALCSILPGKSVRRRR